MTTIYDRDGNRIELTDRWNQSVLDVSEYHARVIEKRNGQFRMGPTLYWSAWAGVLAGYVLSVALLGMSMLLWGLTGSLHTASSGPWAAGIGGALALVLTGTGNYALLEYYKHHGVPHRVKTDDKEMYCKKCQAKIEKDLDIAKQERVAEAMATLQQLTGEKYVPITNELEAPKEEPEDWMDPDDQPRRDPWKPPRQPYDRKGR